MVFEEPDETNLRLREEIERSLELLTALYLRIFLIFGMLRAGIDCANPSNSLGSVKFYFSPLSTNINYFYFVATWFVEFRGRR